MHAGRVEFAFVETVGAEVFRMCALLSHRFAVRLERTPAEIHRLFAALAGVGFVEFIGEDLDQFAAIRTLALEGRKGLVRFEPGAMHRCRHGGTPFLHGL
jgi:hypothetical protein